MKNQKTEIRGQKSDVRGITLIALIITVILLLILAGVAINVAINGDLFGKAQTAVDKTNNKVGQIQSETDRLMEVLDNIEDGTTQGGTSDGSTDIHNWTRSGDTLTCSLCNTTLTIGTKMNYTSGGTSSTSISADTSGWSNQTLTRDDTTTWVVLGIEDSDGNGTYETLLLTTAQPTADTITLYGAAAYNNAISEINRMCKELYGDDARGMTIEDVNNCLAYTPAGGMYYNGSYYTTGNFTTKLKDLSIWESIKAKGTYTPDGTNTEEALGNYVLDGYWYYLSDDGTYLVDDANSSNTSHTITTIEKSLIFGSNTDYFYWLASRGVRGDSDYALFGPGYVCDGFACSVDGSFDSNGNSYYYNFWLRAVVSLRSDIPSASSDYVSFT